MTAASPDTPHISQDAALGIPPERPHKNPMDRFIDAIEWIAAFFVGIVALNTFIAVVMRKFFAVTIPDYYNIGQFMLGVLIFWGIAATSYRGSHITVDLVWANATPKYQRWIDVFATLVLLFVVTVQTYTLFDKVVDTYNSNIVTMDLQLPVWPFFLVSWIGDVSAVLLIAIRTWRLVMHPEQMHEPKIKTAE
jgi:TRAP-type C4-dicarboxylate transport system permease small subunit